MEKNYKRVPFYIELANKIQSGEVEGRIVTSDGKEVKLFENNSEFKCFIHKERDGIHVAYGREEVLEMLNLHIELLEETPKHEFKVGDKVRVNLPKDVVTKYLILGNYQGKVATIINVEGSYVKVKADGLQPYSFDVDYLIPYEEKHEFKPFDKVLVRENDNQVWHCDFFAYTDNVHNIHYCVAHSGSQILLYEGNEHLVGTTDKPKEE